MISRKMYRGIWKEGQAADGLAALQNDSAARQLVEDGRLMTAAAFSWENNVFLYYECTGTEIEPALVAGTAGSYLIDWEGGSVSPEVD